MEISTVVSLASSLVTPFARGSELHSLFLQVDLSSSISTRALRFGSNQRASWSVSQLVKYYERASIIEGSTSGRNRRALAKIARSITVSAAKVVGTT
jgi:hypothetical protein